MSGKTIKIYVYTTPLYRDQSWESGDGSGWLKVGKTTKGNVEDRIKQQVVAQPSQDAYEILWEADGVGPDGESFSDKKVHAVLRKMGRRQIRENGVLTEWFECTVDDVKAAVKTLQEGKEYTPNRIQDFGMRPEQDAAVRQTALFFFGERAMNDGKPPHFLWNAKMRFGKTFTTYQLARMLGWQRILVLTYKPAVQSAWETDLLGHVDFKDWQFIGKGKSFDDIDPDRPFVYFTSFQNMLGKTPDGSIKKRLEAMNLTEWDCVVLDEYHFGAWRDAAKDIYDSEPKEDDDFIDFDESVFAGGQPGFSMTAKNYLYLSGTPFRTLAAGEFLEDQIFSWTYADEQRAKRDWDDADGPNPYLELPTMKMYTYKLPDEIVASAVAEGADEFDLNVFFAAEKVDDPETGKKVYRFKNEANVNKWLRLIRGDIKAYDASVTGTAVVQPPMPYENEDLLRKLNHTFWFLPSVASCYAMADLLAKPENSFFHKYRVVVAAGTKAGIGIDALPPVQEAITGHPKDAFTITLSCGKLTTGVTVPEWSGIFMLRNLQSPETYFQAAFRVQSPWTETNPKGEKTVVKPECYVFDFAPVRALRLVADYATQLDNATQKNFEEKVGEFLDFLPVLCFDGASFTELDAKELLDFAAVGTGSVMLARKWESARLVDVTTGTLERLLNNPDLLDRLVNIESFRNRRTGLKDDLEKTIGQDHTIKKARNQEKLGEKLEPVEKKEISEQEKENRKFRKELRDNLLKFVTRIPIFMFLTDFREETLRDVITKFEPTLFKKVTGLEVEDFEQLCDLGVFNTAVMNEAVFAFRRFEDPSLQYLGDRREGNIIGGFDDAYATRDEVLSGVAEKETRP
jgi:hypothetical protein